MSDEQRPNQSGLVPSSSHVLTTRSSALVRRGLEALRTQQTRVLRFPPDRSMGILYVPRRSYYEELESWEARGNVTVPTEKKLTLDISDEASADLSPFAALAPDDLQALSLAHSSVSNVELRHIGKLTGLQELDLHNTQVGDPGLVHLKGLVGLQGLDLWETRVSDAGLVHLRELKNLRILLLSGSQISDTGLVHLRESTALEELQLLRTRVSDAGLIHLRRLTALRKLHLLENQVSDAAAARLQRALPNCRIFNW